MKSKTHDDPPWITYQRAAELLSVSKRSIEHYVKSGRLIAAGTGSGKRVFTASVLQQGGQDA